MKNKEFMSIGKQLVANLDGFVASRNLLILVPARHVLRAVCFYRSIDPRAFYLEAFFMALYVPTGFLSLNLGKRLGGSCHTWNADAPGLIEGLLKTLKREALPFLGSKDDDDDTINRLVLENAADSDNRHDREAAAYTLVRMGRIPEALETIDDLLKSLRDTVQWHQDIRERVSLIKEDLDVGGDAAMARLNQWEAETIQNLKLESFVER